MITTNKIPIGQVESEVSQTITNGVTDKSPSEDAVFDALANIKDTFMWQSLMGPSSPADSTTYYFGTVGIAPNTTDTNFSFKMGYNFKIVGAIISTLNNGTQGSSENNTINFRNITTSTSSLISNSVKTNATAITPISQTVTGLSITGSASDDVCLEWVTPTYATNPTVVAFVIRLYIEKLS
jgi:hypothetical protein